MPHDLLLFSILIPVLALADRWCGGGLGWERLAHDHGGPLRGRPVYYVVLPLVGLLMWLADDLGIGLALAWLIYRGAFPFPHDTINGKRLGATVFRHLLFAIAATVALVIVYRYAPAALLSTTGHSVGLLPRFVLPFLLYAFAATTLAVENGKAYDRGVSVNATVEAARGMWAGAALAAAIIIEKVS